MRHRALLACRVKPSTCAYARRLTYAPHQCLLRSCALQLPTSGQRRLIQSASIRNDRSLLQRNPRKSNDGHSSGSVKKSSQSARFDVQDGNRPEKPVRDYSWVFTNTGDRIETINGKALPGIEEYVSHRSGTKLLCSWNVGYGDERNILVPGDAPRVRDMALPVDLKPEAVQAPPSSEWTLGNPQASFEPLFASLASMNPLANFDSTDVIARSGTLHLLLGVARGNIKQLGASNTAVAFHIALVNNTVIIKRMENPTKGHTLGRGSSPTMTGSFVNKITEMKASEESIGYNHSQAVRYDLAHLRCVVITPVDAATGNASLPPLTAPNLSVDIPQASGSIKVKRGGRGVPPGAVTKLMTGVMASESTDRRLNYRGELKIKPAGQAKLWFERPKTILQGHLGPASPNASADTSRLDRISVREAEPILDQVDDACQLELRRLVTLLDRLRVAARRAGGSCILSCLPERRKSESEPATLPARFDLYECGPGVEPLVLDWHVERFWSR